jgi:hypothetical protein
MEELQLLLRVIRRLPDSAAHSDGRGEAGRSGIGASSPLRRIPAIVSFLNPKPAIGLVGGNRSSCPEADL